MVKKRLKTKLELRRYIAYKSLNYKPLHLQIIKAHMCVPHFNFSTNKSYLMIQENVLIQFHVSLGT